MLSGDVNKQWPVSYLSQPSAPAPANRDYRSLEIALQERYAQHKRMNEAILQQAKTASPATLLYSAASWLKPDPFVNATPDAEHGQEDGLAPAPQVTAEWRSE